MSDEYWWIKNKTTGKLVTHGRFKDRAGRVMYQNGAPFLYKSEEEAAGYCFKYEKAVRIRLVEIKR